jgi:lysophospholipase L1-like esterase
MRAERRGAPWWAVVVSGIGGALVATALLAAGAPQGVQAAAAQQPVEDNPSVVFLGDSWTEGRGATGLHGYAPRTGEALGWDYQVLGVSGSGYARPGEGSTFAQRIDRAVALDSDVLVVQGSLNERHSTLDVLAPAATETLARLAAEAGEDTQVLVLGASYNPGTPVETMDGINRTIEAAATAAGLRFVDVAALDWTDPADPTVWADSIHPNDAGHQRIADRLTELLRDVAGR